jgi:hypothetical protein
VWISAPCDRIQGLDASLRGDSTVDLSSSLEYIWGASSPGLVWACPQLSLTPLLEGSCRTPVEGQLSIPRGLYWAQSPLSIRLEISVHGSPSGPFEARLFRRGSENDAVVGGVA